MLLDEGAVARYHLIYNINVRYYVFIKYWITRVAANFHLHCQKGAFLLLSAFTTDALSLSTK